MTLKDAIESGKPFKRQSWVEWCIVIDGDMYYWKTKGRHTYELVDVLATDWILKNDCEECKDTKIAWSGVPPNCIVVPCPKCSAPKEEPKPALPKMKKITVYHPILRHDGLIQVIPFGFRDKSFPSLGVEFSDYDWKIKTQLYVGILVGWKEEVIEVLDQLPTIK